VVARQIAGFTLLLLPASITPAMLGTAGVYYAAGAVALGAAFLFLALRAAAGARADAQRLLLGSVVYLPALLALMMFENAR
jgi:heme O synthase-like polyprenyltransferase